MQKLIIFDVDGTLYDLDDVIVQNYKMQIDFVAAKTGKAECAIIELFEQNGIFPQVTIASKSATEFFIKSGFSRDEWNAFREHRFPVDAIDCAKAADLKTVSAFRQFGACVLLSSNSSATIQRILAKIGLGNELFDALVCSDRFPVDGPFNKKSAMQYLATRFDVEGPQLISIGDRFSTDVRPALEIGGTGVVVKKPSSLGALLSDMQSNNLRDCDEYEYFCERLPER